MSKNETMSKKETATLLLMLAVALATFAVLPGTGILPVLAQDVDGDEDQDEDGDNNAQNGIDDEDEDNDEDED